ARRGAGGPARLERGDRAAGSLPRSDCAGAGADRADDVGRRGAPPDPARARPLRWERERGGPRAGRFAQRPLPQTAAPWFESFVTRRKQRLAHDQHVFLLSLAAGAPGVVATLVLLSVYVGDAKIRWTVGVLVFLVWLFTSVALRDRVLRPLQTSANLLAALREEDFSVRGRGARSGDPLGELLLEVNQLADTLHAQRVGSLEAGALLRRV